MRDRNNGGIYSQIRVGRARGNRTLGGVGQRSQGGRAERHEPRFNQFNVPFTGPKELFQDAKPTGWSIGPGGQNSNLIGVGIQGSETINSGVYDVYPGPHGFSNTVPGGINFYQADGNPKYESTIFTTVSGLTAGKTYTLQFQQAAGQQTQTFRGDTTEQWKVFLGVGGIGTDCSNVTTCSLTGTDHNIEADSTVMMTPSMSNIRLEQRQPVIHANSR